MTEEKKKELEQATSILRTMYAALERKPGDVSVGVVPDREIITVKICGATYNIDVECENVRMMVKQVVDATILKI